MLERTFSFITTTISQLQLKLMQYYMFRIPTDAEKREKWFSSIGYTINAYKNARICSDHFTKDDYYYTGTTVQSRRLTNTAIPSVFTHRSCRRLKKDSRSNIQNDNQDESIIDIKHESIMDIQPQFTIDIQQSTIDIQQSTIDIQHDNLISTEPTLVKNSDTGRRK
ncbi:thap domain-containing protein 6-like protein [Lasius niger]|uniref:Thap domain-containing protein 6-like protein n=1 Tax=Lasius niger TaxID=67767 RepID=A0A0J7KWM1_LASNI|nr:thap domain-containing protein 6-like protein [Lasius niger]